MLEGLFIKPWEKNSIKTEKSELLHCQAISEKQKGFWHNIRQNLNNNTIRNSLQKCMEGHWIKIISLATVIFFIFFFK